MRYYGTRTNERWAAISRTGHKRKRRNTVILNTYIIERWAMDLQSQRRAEAESYNAWALARKALRNLDKSNKAK